MFLLKHKKTVNNNFKQKFRVFNYTTLKTKYKIRNFDIYSI